MMNMRVVLLEIRVRDSQIKVDHAAAERGHLCTMIRMSDLFVFVKDLEKIIYGLGLKLI